MEKTISNHRHLRDFTIIPNDILRNTELSFSVKGLLCYLLSLPNDWEIKVDYIVETFDETERSILRGLKDLIETGYCKRVPKRINGKLAGQMYMITDIPFDFSVPAKNEGAGNPVPADSRPTGNADPRENAGAEENILFNNKELSLFNENERPAPRESANERKCLFEKSKFYNFEKFREMLEKDSDIAGRGIDFYYYYNRIKNWSGGNGQKKNNWILTAKNWMMDDAEKGKLKLENSTGLSPDAMEYLQSMGE